MGRHHSESRSSRHDYDDRDYDSRRHRDDRDDRYYRDDRDDRYYREDRDYRSSRDKSSRSDRHDKKEKKDKHDRHDKKEKRHDEKKEKKEEKKEEKKSEEKKSEEKKENSETNKEIVETEEEKQARKKAKWLEARQKIKERKQQEKPFSPNETQSEIQTETDIKTETSGIEAPILLKKAKMEEKKSRKLFGDVSETKQTLTTLDPQMLVDGPLPSIIETDLEDDTDLNYEDPQFKKHEEIKIDQDLMQSNQVVPMEVEPTNNNLDELDPLDAFMQENNKLLGRRFVSSKLGSTGDSDHEGQEDEEQPEEETFESFLNKKLKTKNIPWAEFSTEPFRKDFYVETPEIARMTEDEVEQFKNKMGGIQVVGKGCPRPVKYFAQMGLSELILKLLEKHGYKLPTPIQAQAIPAIMSGRDVIGCAVTGSGKTVAYLLPLLRHVMDQRPLASGEGPIALVIAPTRELVMQIHKEARKFTRALNLTCVAVYGGVGVASQIGEMKRGAEIVVCTPGRMIDVLTTNAGRVVNLKRTTFVVLDEADRMFDMGFEPQVTRIMGSVRPDRQLVMFSATFPKKVESLARKGQKKPIEIVVGKRSTVCSDVEQHVELLNANQKWRRLLELLKQHEASGTIVFVDTQTHSEKLAIELSNIGYPTQSLHGGMTQEDRDFVLDDFKRGVTSILTATAIASRGLDVEDLKLVVNFDVPNHLEDYVHKVGRTGRMGKKGFAYTFITPEEERYAPAILIALKESNAPVPEELEKMVNEYKGKIERGETVAIASSGFSGKGFQFNEEEQLRKEEERRKEKIAAGFDDEVQGEDDEFYSDDEDMDESAMPSDQSSDPTKPRLDVDELVSSLKDKNKLSSKVSKTEIASSIQELFKKKQEEHLRELEDRRRKDPTGKGGNQKVADEIEINDFPQTARFRVTSRESIQALSEYTDCNIQVKGVYIPPGITPTAGLRKIYLQIDAPSMNALTHAKKEILNILKEEIEKLETAPKGKYKV